TEHGKNISPDVEPGGSIDSMLMNMAGEKVGAKGTYSNGAKYFSPDMIATSMKADAATFSVR
ncbi:MAG: hypothetical protein ACYC3N_01290, partial [Halothiobacillus sp.]